ncbi:hypothetical protein [Erythrobacter sp. QSSC1-22B]|uniref:hypothetical protein n=1 Tax=Erythrobacter sp. QSSC1-22B TaxID=1860125 RepID=UPI00119E307A|nr:hypothetical protein [Erythrobacter sp. QSSC1-22B]
MEEREETSLREYEITTRRPKGGKLTHVHVIQGKTGIWHISVRKNWGDDREYQVNHYNHNRLKTYKRISSALRHIVLDYHYEGPIIVVPFVGKSHEKSF